MPYQTLITADSDGSVVVDATHVDFVDAAQALYAFASTYPGITEYIAPDMNETPIVWTWKITDDAENTYLCIIKQVA